MTPQVAHGYRRPVPTWWPPELGALVVECWADDPDGCAAKIWFIVTCIRRGTICACSGAGPTGAPLLALRDYSVSQEPRIHEGPVNG